jgi:hypothetical protein
VPQNLVYGLDSCGHIRPRYESESMFVSGGGGEGADGR